MNTDANSECGEEMVKRIQSPSYWRASRTRSYYITVTVSWLTITDRVQSLAVHRPSRIPRATQSICSALRFDGPIRGYSVEREKRGTEFERKRPASQPASQPASEPASQPASQPASERASQQANSQPGSQPVNRPSECEGIRNASLEKLRKNPLRGAPPGRGRKRPFRRGCHQDRRVRHLISLSLTDRYSSVLRYSSPGYPK
ncbi:zinc finger CCCH domain-containing protein 13-like, partial [Vespula squamosa]